MRWGFLAMPISTQKAQSSQRRTERTAIVSAWAVDYRSPAVDPAQRPIADGRGL